MYNIYFGNRRIALYNKEEKPEIPLNAVLYSPISHSELVNLPHLFDSTPNIETLCVGCQNSQLALKELSSNLNKIVAGGGLVSNSKGEYLLIYRAGHWDLPKGTQEAGEEIERAALREVEEECGIADLELQSHICNTYHTFHREGQFHFKTTHWFRMYYRGESDRTTPQSSEQIERAIWVEKSQLPYYIERSYSSLKAVFGELL